jgi:O-antigen/teichoic acid export membrane protein
MRDQTFVLRLRRAVARGSLLSTAAFVFAGNVVARALGFAFPLVVARVLDRSEFAAVYFFITTGFSASQLVLTGYPTAMGRYVAAESMAAAKGAWVRSAALAGIPVLIVSLGVGETLSYATDSRPLLMSVVVIGVSIDAYYFAALRGLERYGLLVVYRVGANLAQLILVVVAFAVGLASVESMVIIYALVYLVPIAVIESREGALRSVLANARRAAGRRISALTRFAIPSLVSGTSWGVIFGLDVFFVGLLAREALADYAAARALAVPIIFVPLAIDVVLLPRVAASNVADRWRLLRQALVVSIAAAIAAALAYVFVGDLLIEIAYPPSYEGAGDFFIVLTPALGLLGIYSVVSEWWMGSGRPLSPAIGLSAGAVCSIAAHLVLTRQYGGMGAGGAMLIGAGIALAVLGAQTLRLRAREQVGDEISA